MKFKTLSEYDDEIKMYNRMLDILKKCIEVDLKRGATPDYELLKYIRKLEKEKEDLEFHKEEFLEKLDSW